MAHNDPQWPTITHFLKKRKGKNLHCGALKKQIFLKKIMKGKSHDQNWGSLWLVLYLNSH